jgi:hypothetical protein
MLCINISLVNYSVCIPRMPYIHAYIYMCVCVCVCKRGIQKFPDWGASEIHDSKQTRVKTAHFHPATCNLAHLLTTIGSPTIYWNFALPQLLYIWRHQSEIFWMNPRIWIVCVCVCMYVCIYLYRCAPVSMGNTFQNLPRLRETADNTERYI